MNNKLKLQSIASLTLVGLVFFMLIRYAAETLTQSLQLIAIIFQFDVTIYNSLYFIPKILVLIFWILIVFKYLNSFSGEITINTNSFKRQAIRIGIVTLLLAVWSTGIDAWKYMFDTDPTYSYFPTKDFLRQKGIIIAFLGLAQLAVIIIGFFRVFGDKNTAANNV